MPRYNVTPLQLRILQLKETIALYAKHESVCLDQEDQETFAYWRAHRNQAEAELSGLIKSGATPTLTLPAPFHHVRGQKPGHVEFTHAPKERTPSERKAYLDQLKGDIAAVRAQPMTITYPKDKS